MLCFAVRYCNCTVCNCTMYTHTVCMYVSIYSTLGTNQQLNGECIESCSMEYMRVQTTRGTAYGAYIYHCTR